ncbi:response regulator [Rhizobacter sp. Root1221]|uniref:response regulator n=1 Tax=Rhizobacter sp. Root1221 TaxID=1736433 RepID=UPI0006FEAA57|nr:response regulator [Rhizobacter sp. Root1221]KQV81190.1 two-component system response regulator [Rhizobacter sp. Root1221]
MIETLNLNIVLVEDDDVAAESVMRGLTRSGVTAPVIWAPDGEMALRVLRGADPERRAQRPRVVLLDLNMPRMNGFEFLQHVRADPALRDDVVFVLTTSDADADRTRAYHENVAGYMVKASVGPQFAKLAQLLQSYRLAVRFP